MNEQKNNGRGIFYGVIGVATLVVAIIGATFAYFTATNSANNAFSGNMATISFGLDVVKVTTVDESKGGMIPMSNTMVEAALITTDTSKQVCVDNNGNAVCQVYRIDVSNTGTASLFLDGYVTLTGGSGVVTDAGTAAGNKTTMRWAQAFCTLYTADDTETQGSEPTAKVGDVKSCTTAGKTTTTASTTDSTAGIDTDWSQIGVSGEADGYNNNNIVTGTTMTNTSVGQIAGNDYDIINKNYIRISDHAENATYDRDTDITSALVYNQYLDAASTSATTDEVSYYIVIWLAETGHNQTATQTPDIPDATPNPDALNFFSGNVVFNSAQGSEVTATFTGYTAVESDQVSEGE